MPLIMQKSGGSGGVMSYIAFVPGRDVGIFVGVNRVDFTMFFGLTHGGQRACSRASRRANLFWTLRAHAVRQICGRSLMSVQIFLSIVSDEFRRYRDLLRSDLTRHNVEVKIREDSRTSAAKRSTSSMSISPIATPWCISSAT